MDTLKDKVQQAISGYTGKGLNGYSFLIASPDQSAFTVVSVGYIKAQRIASADLIVRIIENQIIIERDDNDKPLVDVLVQIGIPREMIILAYAGEPAPEAI
jgi:hypothetical protein